MPYLLLTEGRVVEVLPESARLARKFADVVGGREIYLTWHGSALRRVAIYPLHSTGRASEEQIARLEIDGSDEAIGKLCSEWRIPSEWTVADYRP